MTCWRFDLRRKMIPYLECWLPASESARLEQHLVDCDSCRSLLVRLRAGHQMAQRLAALPIEGGSASDFEFGLAALEAGVSAAGTHPSVWRDRLERLATPRMVTALSVLVLLQLGLLVVSNRGVLLGERSRVSVTRDAVNFREFRRLSISELKSNTQPHVSTEGYVEDVHTDEEEGTVAFKLVESPQNAESFVVCEIMSPIQIAPPRAGTRIRVYGVARYDAQNDRNWNEVNPVLSIVPLNP